MKKRGMMTYKEALAFCAERKINPHDDVLAGLTGIYHIICKVCGKDKRRKRFHKDTSTKTGRKSVCIQCVSANSKAISAAKKAEIMSAWGCMTVQDPKIIFKAQAKLYEQHGFYTSATMKWGMNANVR